MIEVLDELDLDSDLKQTVIAVAQAALLYEGRAGDATIRITDGETVRELNRVYRNIDSETDVLSFPSQEGEGLLCVPDKYLGDIAISLPRAKLQAEEYGHSLKRELAFLTVHGMLHIIGYDHINEDERKKMFDKQEQILEKMEIKR